ncbi:MAG: asparagine synthetase B [archaeon]
MSRLLCDFKGGKCELIGTKKLLTEGSVVCDCEIYNAGDLRKKYGIASSEDVKFLSELVGKVGLSVLDEVDGVYSLAYYGRDAIFLARDLIGLKPMWYSLERGLAFGFVKNDLEKLGYKKIEELNPRNIFRYDVKEGEVSFVKRSFFSIKPQLKDSENVIVKNLSDLFVAAVKKRVPKKKFAVSFSGGIDSTLIALVCKKLGCDFTCYTSHFSHPGMEASQDLFHAQKVAKSLGFRLEVVEVDAKKTELILSRIVPLIGADAVKVGVALPFFAACEQARKDKLDTIFSGLGSEEIFAGYRRHKLSSNLNEECLLGLLHMYERDTYRDYIVGDLNSMKVETPFLDNALVDYSLKIPSSLKLRDGVEKFIIRRVALSLGLPDEFAWRKKKAAQYGSNSDKMLAKLAKKSGFKFKHDYLKTFLKV